MSWLRDAGLPDAPPSHLGDALAGLVDGHLDHQGRERALAHLAHCDPCRTEADGLRRLRSQLLDLGGRPTGVPAGLSARLLALDVSAVRDAAAHPAPARLGSPVAGPPVGTRRPAGSPSGPRRPRGRARVPRSRVPRAAAAGAAIVLGLGGVLALGSPTSRPTRPAFEPAGNVQQVDLRQPPARSEVGGFLDVRPAVRSGR